MRKDKNEKPKTEEFPMYEVEFDIGIIIGGTLVRRGYPPEVMAVRDCLNKRIEHIIQNEIEHFKGRTFIGQDELRDAQESIRRIIEPLARQLVETEKYASIFVKTAL